MKTPRKLTSKAVAAVKTTTPHKLELYALAVQQPWAQVNWLANAYAAHYPGRWARHLREDFAGSCALAMTWVAHDHDHTALAVDNHGPTVRWAAKRAKQLAKEDALDLARISFEHGDVMDTAINTKAAKADLIAAFNFSVNIYHDYPSLVGYFKSMRSNLNEHGLFAMDAYGGPGAWRLSTQHRRVRPARELKIPAFDYYWEQQDVDPLTGMVQCAIHFKTKAQGRLDNAFVYHWRLWSLPELIQGLQDAGFGRTQVWCQPQMSTEDNDQDAQDAQMDGDGMIEPVERIGPREDFVAYITAEKQP